MRESRRRLLERLKQVKQACTLMEAEEALATSGFLQGRSKGHTRAWHYEEITLTLHRPHGKHLNPGAVAMIIRTIEQAALRQERQERKEKENPTHVG
jgi:hypothetical protein